LCARRDQRHIGGLTITEFAPIDERGAMDGRQTTRTKTRFQYAKSVEPVSDKNTQEQGSESIFGKSTLTPVFYIG
jgi:hypothetical protein